MPVLIAAGASVDPGDSSRGQTPLMWAAAEGHPETMQALIEAGANVDARSTIIVWERQRTDEPRDKWLPPGGWTPLLLAARENCVACVDVLAKAGADLNIVDPERHTASVPFFERTGPVTNLPEIAYRLGRAVSELKRTTPR